MFKQHANGISASLSIDTQHEYAAPTIQMTIPDIVLLNSPLIIHRNSIKIYLYVKTHRTCAANLQVTCYLIIRREAKANVLVGLASVCRLETPKLVVGWSLPKHVLFQST